MPLDRYSYHDAFDIEVLNPQALHTSDGLQTALRAIEAVCYRGDPEIARMVEVLNSRSCLLEYIISVLGEGAYTKVSKWMVTGFPASAGPSMNAMGMQLLQRFSSSLLSVKYPSTTDVPPNLYAFGRKVELSLNVLKNIEENAAGALTGGSIPPVSSKKGKVAAHNRRIDPLPFDCMGIPVPNTDAEARDVYVKVLSQLRSILENYLLVLRKPMLSHIFKSAYMKTELPLEGEPDQSRDPAMKAGLYFDDIEGFGEWSILLSTRAQKDLRDVRRADGAIFQIVVKKIKQLSQGRFSHSNQKPLTGPKMKLHIYAAMVTGETRLVYHIDCVPDLKNSHGAESQQECQAIRMFGIFTLAQLHRRRFWNNLSWQLQRRGPEYIERCTPRNQPLSDGDDVILPENFPPLSYQVEDVPPDESLVKVSEEDMKEIHSMLVLDKFVSLSQVLLDSILADREVAHVFSVSTLEQEIIEHPSSCYVIGRSGTGKTTTMLFKMLGIQRAWEKYPDMGPKPRQLFITQSGVLALKVEEYFVKLMSSLKAAACSPEESRAGQEGVEQGGDLTDQDENQQWRSDLPEKFSELLDGHFPLFITYSQLCTMLQNDIRLGSHNNSFITPETDVLGDEATSSTSPTSPRMPRLRAGSGVLSSSDYMQQSRKNFVSYSVFLSSYWDRLPQTLTRVLDPALVFGEFMGVIKGSENTVGTKQRCLDRESYKSLSVRSQATFSHKRDEIYDLFVAYAKLKGRGDYDATDRTHHILEELRDVGLAGRKVDFLYVDEVQDNLLIDTLLLRTICANRHGLFWGGDTAQTISIGSSFRFADLKAFQHRIEKQLSHELGLTHVKPKTFELVVNYRSHSGIVNCARSIIKFIIHYWPHSIDALQPERAATEGHRPTFFAGQDDADWGESFFGNSQGEPIEFGAEQCILVRNDATKDRLQQRLGNSLIMTLYESKGLEFNDVLLYNFFKDSTATPNQWRLLLNGVSNGGDYQNAPTFDETRHASICVELKFLYVAITRARNNLWIVDSSESAEPMKVYWSSQDQIEIRTSTADAPRLAVSSTSEEWTNTGRTMFSNKRYEQASVAFQRAGRNREAAICDAYLLREKARLVSTTTSAARIRAFTTAADAFITCARDSPSKQVKERLACYKAAGECYSEARKLKKAGDNYQLAEDYAAAARTYREGGYFDEMVEVITQHGNTLESGLVERLKMAAQLHYFKGLNTKAALRLFPTVEDALEFLEDYDLDEARVKLLMELGRVTKAAAIHAKNGNILKAVEILTASGLSVDHVRHAIEYLLTGLRRSLTLGVLPASNSTASKLLVYADKLDEGAITEQEANELAMFKAIQRVDHASLRTLAKTFIGMENDPAALLCLDHAFSSPLELQNLPFSEVETLVSLYFDYIRLLNRFLRDDSLVQGSNHQRLFGFQVSGENRYLVPKHCILHEKLTSRPSSSKKGHACGSDDLRRGIIQLISARISDRTKTQNDTCHDVRGFLPCLHLLVEKKCDPPNGEGTCPFQHIQPEQLTADWYNAHLRLILLQFQILNLARCENLDVKGYWLKILYSALHPPVQRLGSLANLDISKIPEGADGLRIVREWVKQVCYELRYRPPKPPGVDHFGQQLMVVCALAFDLDRDNAQNFLPRTPIYGSTLWPRPLFRGEGNFIVQDFVAFLVAEVRYSLALGALYLREVLHCGLRVDLNALCDLAERLSGLFIMAYKFNSHGGALHNVTLPRSWFINFILPGMDLGKDTSTFSMFASTIIDLMQRIDAQVQRYHTASAPETDEQFIAGGNQVTTLMGPLYIARICLCLCLMGHNTNDDNFKDRILTGIQSLRKREGKFTSWIYQRYAAAEDWDDLVCAFTESLKNSSLDEMVLLVHTGTPDIYERRPKYVRLVSYNILDEVPGVLLPGGPNSLGSGTISVRQQQPHVEAATGTQPDGGHDRRRQQKHIDGAPQERIHDGKEAEAVTAGGDHKEEIDETRVNAAKVIQDAYRRHLERKRTPAVRKIQAAYRRYLKRKSAAHQGTGATEAHYWHLLRKRSKKMKWSKDSQYYLLFRVPLAYILVCLDVIGAFAESGKKEANKRLMAADHSGTDDLMEVVEQHKKLLRKAVELQKKLSPSSKFHEGGPVTDLQRVVLEVKALVESLNNIPGSIGTRNQIQERWDRGWKWILEKDGSRTKGKRTQKLRLVLKS